MRLNEPKMPKIDGLLSLTIAKIEKGKEYPEHYIWEDDNYPVEDIRYMEWSEDWFDSETLRSEDPLLTMQPAEKLITAKRDGYLVIEYKTITNHPHSALTEDVLNLGIQEIVGNLAKEIKEVYEKSHGWENQLPEKEIVLAFGCILDTDWETGHTEAESDYLGYFDWMTGQII